MITEKQEKEYLEHGGQHCPACKSSNVKSGQMEVDGASAYAEVECGKCGATWQDIYRLSGIDNLKK